MRKLLALVTLMYTTSCGSATPALTEADLISYSKKIDVAKLDPTLQSQPLEEWLLSGPARIERLTWSAGINCCDDKPDDQEPPNGHPLCATINFCRGGVIGFIRLTLGTTRKGIVEPPKFDNARVERRPGVGMTFEQIAKLSDLPTVLSKGPMSQLNYSEILEYAKMIDVAKLDPTLQSQSLEGWLLSGPARLDHLGWDLDNCAGGSANEEPPEGHPLCVRIVCYKGGVFGFVEIKLGTTRKGIVELPRFEHARVEIRPGGPSGENVAKLSDLPRALEKLLEEQQRK